MTLQAIFDHFYLELNPSDNADRQVSTCSIQWCKKMTFEEVVACTLIVLGPSFVVIYLDNCCNRHIKVFMNENIIK